MTPRRRTRRGSGSTSIRPKSRIAMSSRPETAPRLRAHTHSAARLCLAAPSAGIQHFCQSISKKWLVAPNRL
jgi:hypothetical protein